MCMLPIAVKCRNTERLLRVCLVAVRNGGVLLDWIENVIHQSGNRFGIKWNVSSANDIRRLLCYGTECAELRTVIKKHPQTLPLAEILAVRSASELTLY
jgi:hypothetical protein